MIHILAQVSDNCFLLSCIQNLQIGWGSHLRNSSLVFTALANARAMDVSGRRQHKGCCVTTYNPLSVGIHFIIGHGQIWDRNGLLGLREDNVKLQHVFPWDAPMLPAWLFNASFQLGSGPVLPAWLFNASFQLGGPL